MSVLSIGKPSSDSDCRRELAEAQARVLRLEAQLDAHARELDELNHRIANSLQLASGFLLLQRHQLDDETAKAVLSTASQRIEAIAKLHRYLAEEGASPRVDLGAFLQRIAPELAASTGLTCRVEADPVEVSGETAMQLAVAVNELVINAGKHAYAGREGEVRISCRQTPDDGIALSVADGGPGLTAGFGLDGENGLGFGILNSIARQLGGALEAVTDDGARFTLTLPRLTQPSSRAYSASGRP